MHYDRQKDPKALSGDSPDYDSPDYGVIITTPHIKFEDPGTRRLHRLIVDESHLIHNTNTGGYAGN